MISEDINRRLAGVAQDLAYRAINECASIYGFDACEAISRLGLENVVVRRENRKPSSKKEVVSKPSFPLPYNGECDVECCQALRQNNGLYTQCQSAKKVENVFCKSCQQLVAKSADGIPEYGTIEQRQAVGPFEYVDPKGRRPVAYTKVMRKYKVSEEQVLAEAGKFNIKILAEHFVSPAAESKRGRPKKEGVAAKEPKGAKGRPKKTKKVLEIDGGDDEDLFVSMVAAASGPSIAMPLTASESENSDNESIGAGKITKKLSSKENDYKKAAKAIKKQEEEVAKLLKKQQEEEAKSAKALKKQEEDEAKAAKVLKKQQEEEAKALKKQQEDEAKAAKLVKKQKEDEAKAAKAVPKASAKEEAKSEQQDSVKKFEFEGKKYLKSKQSGVIYDRDVYDASGDIVQIGRWNESKQCIDFLKQEDSDEEESSVSDEEEKEEDYEN
jgi:hypothetical protein